MKRPGGFDGRPEQPAREERRERAPRPPRAARTPEREPKRIARTGPAEPVEPAEVVPLAEPAPVADARPVVVSKAEAATGSKRSDLDPVKIAEKRVRRAEKLQRRSQRRETRRFTASLRRTRRRTLIALGAVAALVLFVLLGAFTPLMSVREVRVEGAVAVNVADVTAALARFDGTPLALVDETDVLKALSGFPLIQRFAVERVPPHTLVVRIEERTPVIALQTDAGLRLYDAAGVLIAEGADRPAGVPLGADGVADTSTEAFRTAATIVRDMPSDLRAQLESVHATTSQDVTFMLSSGVEVFWGNADETRRKSLVLNTMLSALAGRGVSHIDVSSVEAPVFR